MPPELTPSPSSPATASAPKSPQPWSASSKPPVDTDRRQVRLAPLTPPAPTPSQNTASTSPRTLYDSIERNRVALKGPVTTPIGGGFSSINVTLRKKFDLYANFRPVKNPPRHQDPLPRHRPHHLPREHRRPLRRPRVTVFPGVVESLKIITEKASTRIARFAFEYARKHGRKKIHAIHKANIMKMSDGLFLECCQARRRGLPGDHLRRAHRRQHLHAARHEPLPVRRHPHRKPLRRHPLRPLLRPSSAASAWSPAPTSAPSAPSSRPSTAPPPTSPARTRPTPPLSSNPPSSCSTTSTNPPPPTKSRPRSKRSTPKARPSPAT